LFTEDGQANSATLDDLQYLLDQTRDRLYEKAQSCADFFWENHLQLDGGTKRPSSLGCRVRRKGESVYMVWYFNTWRKKIDGGSQPFSNDINKGTRGFQYNLRKLYAHAHEWEYGVIRESELAFANLRQQNKHLTAMRRSLQALSKLESDWHGQVSVID